MSHCLLNAISFFLSLFFSSFLSLFSFCLLSLITHFFNSFYFYLALFSSGISLSLSLSLVFFSLSAFFFSLFAFPSLLALPSLLAHVLKTSLVIFICPFSLLLVFFLSHCPPFCLGPCFKNFTFYFYLLLLFFLLSFPSFYLFAHFLKNFYFLLTFYIFLSFLYCPFSWLIDLILWSLSENHDPLHLKSNSITHM